MNIVLWIIQVAVAFVTGSGAAWRIFNYSNAAKAVSSVQSLSQGAWIVIGSFEILCALGLILPGLLGLKGWTAIAAMLLAAEMLLVTALHLKHFGLQFTVTNPAVWTFGIALAAAFIAYGRFALKPF